MSFLDARTVVLYDQLHCTSGVRPAHINLFAFGNIANRIFNQIAYDLLKALGIGKNLIRFIVQANVMIRGIDLSNRRPNLGL